MCGRSRCTLAPEDVAAAAGVPPDQLGARWPNRRAAPPPFVKRRAWTPVVRAGGGGVRDGGGGADGAEGGEGGGGEGGGGGRGRVVETMKWGLVPSFTAAHEAPDHFRMFNARSETVAEKPVFSRLLGRRRVGWRCVVLLNGFYEWKKDAGGRKQPYYVHLKGEGGGGNSGSASGGGNSGAEAGGGGKGGAEAGGGGGKEAGGGGGERVMRLAGLYDTWTNAEGQLVPTYTILTTDSSPRLAWLHDRMPALLPGDGDVSAWLEGGKLQAVAPYNGPDLAWHPVTPAMGKASYQAPDACRDSRAAKGAITSFFAPSPGKAPPGGGGRSGVKGGGSGAAGGGGPRGGGGGGRAGSSGRSPARGGGAAAFERLFAKAKVKQGSGGGGGRAAAAPAAAAVKEEGGGGQAVAAALPAAAAGGVVEEGAVKAEGRGEGPTPNADDNPGPSPGQEAAAAAAAAREKEEGGEDEGGLTASALVGAGLLLAQRKRRPRGPAVIGWRGGLGTTHRDAISVVSYNILADCYAWNLTYCAPLHLVWQYRWPAVAAALEAAAADIVCLQEVDAAKLEDLQAWAAAFGYGIAAQEVAGKPALCATLYKVARFRPWWADTKRSRAVCCALLYLDSAGATQARSAFSEVLYVANMHLEGHPDKGAERMVQARNALASLARHQESQGLPPAACSVVACGDFNEGPAGGVAHLLRAGWAPLLGAPGAKAPAGGGGGGGGGGGLGAGLAEEVSEATQPYLLQDAYAANPLPYTRRVPRSAASIDQLWVSAHAAVTHLLHATSPADAEGMPNAQQPSDHLPLGATVLLPAAAAAN
ncbi:MAG: hypothetical protein J3K34DRAFT_489601 [Monoraphidium minutum]|nr:MAG: hypothetical protein J3K34DRAFT_489601 [Monoraphidium minutum]